MLLKGEDTSRQTVIGALFLVMILLVATQIVNVSIISNVMAYDTQSTYINVTVNGSIYVEETNATLLGWLTNNGSFDTNCWFQWNPESATFTSPEGNITVGVIANNTHFSLNAAPLTNGTLYYFRTLGNNTNGWSASYNSSYFLTKPQPASNLDISLISGGYNISWTNGDGTNNSYLVVNTNHVPYDRLDGSNIYFGSNNYYEHVPLNFDTTYYYRLWSYANRSSPVVYKWSDGNISINDTFTANATLLLNPNPANNSAYVAITITNWNITIESPRGRTFNWTIESNFSSNLSNEDSNGSKNIRIDSGNLSHGVTYTIYVNSSESANNNWTNETFFFSTSANTGLTFSSSNPTNQTGDVSASLVSWTIDINDGDGDPFDWDITTSPNVGTNISTGSFNGTFNVVVSGNLTYEQTINVYVNATDGLVTLSKSYWFVVEDNPVFTWTTLTFGGQADVVGYEPILSNEQPANTSTNVNMYPMLNITVTEPQGQKFNVTWLTNKSGSWVAFAWNTSVTDGTFQQQATWANESNTLYGWQVRVNDSAQYWTNDTFWFQTATYTWSSWSSWWTFNYGSDAPQNLTATTYNETAINLTWDLGVVGVDAYVLVYNNSGWSSYPLIPQNGTEIYNGTNLVFNHTGLVNSTRFYYTIWSWNNTEKSYSAGNDTATAATQGDIMSYNVYPPNLSTANNRPPTNMSIQINGTNINIYYYYWNMTSWPNAYSLLYTWTNRNTGRFEVLNLDTNWSTSFVWGDHDYNWSTNTTDGITWYNTSHKYTTKGSRYDVTNSGDVISGDVSAAWANRHDEAPYDGIYDVDHGGDIVSGDISLIWANRT